MHLGWYLQKELAIQRKIKRYVVQFNRMVLVLTHSENIIC